MSNISGRCDFKDHLWARAETEEEAFNKFNGTKLYIRQPLPDDFDWEVALKNKINIPETYYKKVEYSSIKDLIPYYSHLIVFAVYDNKDSRNSVICITRESSPDREEREILEWQLKEVIKIYNRCKRKKIEFNVEDVVKKIVWNGRNEEPYRELVKRVKIYGKKANIDNIHLELYESYRRKLVGEMLRHGIDPCEYGYERFINK